jgi:hypothetical protein
MCISTSLARSSLAVPASSWFQPFFFWCAEKAGRILFIVRRCHQPSDGGSPEGAGDEIRRIAANIAKCRRGGKDTQTHSMQASR